jgi:hypothetical protein
MRIRSVAVLLLTGAACTSTTEPVEEQALFSSLVPTTRTICGLAQEGRLLCLSGADHFAFESEPSLDLRFRSLSYGITLDFAPHVCGIDLGGETHCWSGDETPRHLGGWRFDTVSPQSYHTCALSRSGSVYCWGGMLANGVIGASWNSRETVLPEPTLYSEGLQFSQLEGSRTHSCALTSSGAAYCWGLNASGQLGSRAEAEECIANPGPHQGTVPCSRAALLVEGDLSFASLAVGDQFTCGLTADGSLYCWGRRFGDVPPGAADPVPTRLADAPPFTQIHARHRNICGITPDGAAYCWGGGVGDWGPQATPVAFAPEVRFRSITPTTGGACGISVDEDVYCYGRSQGGSYYYPVVSRISRPLIRL